MSVRDFIRNWIRSVHTPEQIKLPEPPPEFQDNVTTLNSDIQEISQQVQLVVAMAELDNPINAPFFEIPVGALVELRIASDEMQPCSVNWGYSWANGLDTDDIDVTRFRKSSVLVMGYLKGEITIVATLLNITTMKKSHFGIRLHFNDQLE